MALANLEPERRGDTWRWLFKFPITGTANYLDIQGYKFFFTMKSELEDTDADAIIKEDVELVSGTPLYQVEIVIDNVRSAAVVPGKYYYDLQGITTGGDVFTVKFKDDKPKITILPDVTIRTVPE